MNNHLQNTKIQKIYESINLQQYNTEIYKQKRFELISHSEGFKNQIYYDIFDNRTTGYGFNLDQLNAKKIWTEVFDNKKSFDEAVTGQQAINKIDARKLMEYILTENQRYIQKDYDKFWQVIPNDIKISIESSYYNCPKIVNKNTKFNKNMIWYIKTNEVDYLIESYYELIFRSNPTKSLGIKNRRINDTPTRILNLVLEKYL